MMPMRNPVAARPLAEHSPALLRPGPAAADVLAVLAAAATRMARALRQPLARLIGGDAVAVRIDPPREGGLGDLEDEFGWQVFSLFAAEPGPLPMAGAIDAGAVLRIVDRAFGGNGDMPRAMPRELPLSADLMVQRIEALLGAALAGALAETASITIHAVRRDTRFDTVRAFMPQGRLALIDIAVSEGTRQPWPIRLGLPMAALPRLAGLASEAPARPRGRGGDPMATPFADLPLHLSARLVDTRLPLRMVSQLRVGQVLNLPIARAVPLMAGSATLGHGTIGAVDERVAIQITETRHA